MVFWHCASMEHEHQAQTHKENQKPNQSGISQYHIMMVDVCVCVWVCEFGFIFISVAATSECCELCSLFEYVLGVGIHHWNEIFVVFLEVSENSQSQDVFQFLKRNFRIIFEFVHIENYNFWDIETQFRCCFWNKEPWINIINWYSCNW